MNVRKIGGIILVVMGVMGLAYGGFSYTSDVHRTDLGPLHLSFIEKEHVNIPIWAGVALILIGGALLVRRGKL